MRQHAIGFTAVLATILAMTNVVYADEQADKQAIMQADRAYDAAVERKDVNQIYPDYTPVYTVLEENVIWGKQPSQVNRKKLTPTQEQIEIMRYQQMIRTNNNATCMLTGFSCGF